MKVKEMVMAALLTALSIVIPTMFGFLRVILPPAFSATLAAHTPVILAMFISPAAAVIVALGSGLGFLLQGLSPIVTARAFSHVVFALMGAVMIKRGWNFFLTMAVTVVIHAVVEGLVVLVMMNAGIGGGDASALSMATVTTIGTVVHYSIDICIAMPIYKALKETKVVDILPLNYRKLTV